MTYLSTVLHVHRYQNLNALIPWQRRQNLHLASPGCYSVCNWLSSKHNWASPQSKANLLLFKCVLMKECIHKSTKDMLKDHSSNFCILNSTVHTIQIDVLLLAPLEVSSVHNTSSCFLLCNKSLSQISWNLLKLADDYCLVHAYNPQVKLFA